VRRGLFNVVNNRRGTAYRSRIDDDNRRMAGKTGTSQVFSITAADRARGIIRASDLPWNRRDHALFVSFAPYEAPTCACAVVVEHGGAEHQAAPMARDMLMHAMFGGNPPIEAYPASERPAAQELQDKLPLREFTGTDRVSSRA
jgi:penicillin-binding protein 2